MKQLISSTQTWKTLEKKSTQPVSMRNLFASDPGRSRKMTVNAAGWTVDFSRQLLDESRLSLLIQLAKECKLENAIQDMFSGKIVNKSESRSALHTALRVLPTDKIMVNGKNIVEDVWGELEKMKSFSRNIIDGQITGYTGKKFKYVIAIGIGGQNLGPEMACKALSEYSTGLTVRFVSNIDPGDLTLALKSLNAEETLFLISSKSFTTPETMQNAQAAREWFISQTGSEKAVEKHFIAISTQKDLVEAFGIRAENMFIFWDWVGGRYSMTSSSGLSIMLAIGPENFLEMLEGFRAMDVHYRETPFEENAPVLMALINLWNTSFLGMQAHAVIAYDEYLSLFPDHLQQLVMESLGKRVTEDGTPVDFATCPVFFGGVGTNVQHSYFQLLHQGAGISVPMDFVMFVEALHPIGNMHKNLFFNMLAQANVMAIGETAEELTAMGTASGLIPHKIIPGNKPSTILLGDKLTPKTLGQLVALYENMVHAWGAILGIDMFDQFGVEAGKRFAKKLAEEIPGPLTYENSLELMRTSTGK